VRRWVVLVDKRQGYVVTKQEAGMRGSRQSSSVSIVNSISNLSDILQPRTRPFSPSPYTQQSGATAYRRHESFQTARSVLHASHWTPFPSLRAGDTVALVEDMY
jgi:hypothetical protein